MTVDSVTLVLNKIQGDRWAEVMIGLNGLGIPLPLLKEVQRRYSTYTEKNHACADYYVNYHPEGQWEYLIARLYMKKEFAAARESKIFMSTGKYYTISYALRFSIIA